MIVPKRLNKGLSVAKHGDSSFCYTDVDKEQWKELYGESFPEKNQPRESSKLSLRVAPYAPIFKNPNIRRDDLGTYDIEEIRKGNAEAVKRMKDKKARGYKPKPQPVFLQPTLENPYVPGP